ncbi:MAG TPA: aldehyde dehydrogenase family protein, partial [Leptospiraceae bacterium]|nr:aldehyde dehydrogenase family protein [Leptospiraceae bacterium]
MAKKIAKKKETVKIQKPEKKTDEFRKEVDRLFQLQQANRWNIANTTANQRIEKLNKLRSVIEKYSQEIRDALHSDFRKSPQEVDLTEIMPVISEIKDAVLHLKSW